eukprot:Skav208369  [mRNA]  locus=scaffold1964:632510:633203:- [translate_table: standard]
MTFHPGHTLRRAISQGAFDEKQSRRLFAQLLGAIDYLHQRSIVHCDVKADNIILSGSNLKLVDFGAARSLKRQSAPEIFSPKYAAPEVLDGEGLTEKHDLWCCGQCLHLMLTGRGLVDQWRAIEATFRSRFCKECIEVLCACLNRDPRSRPPATVLLQSAWLKEGISDRSAGGSKLMCGEVWKEPW